MTRMLLWQARNGKQLTSDASLGMIFTSFGNTSLSAIMRANTSMRPAACAMLPSTRALPVPGVAIKDQYRFPETEKHSDSHTWDHKTFIDVLACILTTNLAAHGLCLVQVCAAERAKHVGIRADAEKSSR